MKVALTIAGSDSGGGAGIQADLKTFHQFGVFGTSALVAVTAQNTLAVTGVYPIPPDVVAAQIDAVASDLPPDAVKTGMLATAELVEIAAARIRRHEFRNVVVDPVMIASSGDRLLEDEAVDAVTRSLLPLATLVTPNVPEAELLTGISTAGPDDMERVGHSLLAKGASAALVKGGHLDSDTITDVLVTPQRTTRYEHDKLSTNSTHGTGCTLSAAIAAGLALDKPLEAAVADGLEFVRCAIREAPGLGGGHGPLNHFVSPSLA